MTAFGWLLDNSRSVRLTASQTSSILALINCRVSTGTGKHGALLLLQQPMPVPVGVPLKLNFGADSESSATLLGSIISMHDSDSKRAGSSFVFGKVVALGQAIDRMLHDEIIFRSADIRFPTHVYHASL